jgi:hypothetical protein
MYALKARDKLIKREKEEYEVRHSPRVKSKAARKSSKDSTPPVTVNREARVCSLASQL